LHAGDRSGFEASRSRILEATRGAQRFIVGDPGCALVLQDARAVPFVRLVADCAEKLGKIAGFGERGAVRFHDPCALGRGLSEYAAPRRVLAQALGRAPDEFERNREQAECSGGGAMLPISMPEASTRIAEARLDAHQQAGGGTLVTACASSLRRFRAQGTDAIDIASVVAQSLGLSHE
jgi:Fe-S oxidoreductase